MTPAAAGANVWLDALLRDVDKIEGLLSPGDASALALAAWHAQPGAWVEVGSGKGKSSVLLGAIHRHKNKRHLLWCIDPHEGRLPSDMSTVASHPSTLEVWHKNIAAWGLTNVCRGHIGTVDDFKLPARIPFAFIDGMHDLASVLNDAQTLMQAMDAGCIITFHNYHHHWRGVIDAVDYLCATGRLRFAYTAGTVAVCEVVNG